MPPRARASRVTKSATQSKTWWGQQFLAALERFTDPNRLAKGRTYSSDFRLKQFEISPEGTVSAQVRGNKNAYFGVYEEPTYITTLEFEPISRPLWNAVVALMATKAGVISKLMMNEIPDNIEESFHTLGLNLLPQGRKDCHAQCNCPDYSNPCKHIAGVYYRIAQELDRDPFLLFELRGLSRAVLQEELTKSPLGLALSAQLGQAQSIAPPVQSLHTRPQCLAPPPLEPASVEATLREFWLGKQPAPKPVPSLPAPVSALVIKKQGDFPPFWHRDHSFIAAMEEFYQRVRQKHSDVLEPGP